MKTQTEPDGRYYFLDNLRTTMIFLVVVLHSGIVYESSGAAGFFWIVYDFSTNVFVDVLQVVLDIFIMSVIFFIAGYLTPLSLTKKGPQQFILMKFRRLILPWLLGVLILMPLYKYIFLASRGMAQQHWSEYLWFNNGIFSQSWLWFLPVLFCFDIIYAVFTLLRVKAPSFSFRRAVVPGMLLGFVFGLGVQLLELQGWTKNALINFQNERLLVYFIIFLLGAFAHRERLFVSFSIQKRKFIPVTAAVWLPAGVYTYLILDSRFGNGILDPGTWYGAAAVQAFFVLALAGLMYVIITGFAARVAGTDRIQSELAANSYGVYVTHTVILGGIAWLLLPVQLPSVVKFIVLTAATYAVSNGLVSLYRRLRMSAAALAIRHQ